MQPADFFTDTDPQALEVFLALQRRMPAGQKVALVLELSEMLLQLAEQRERELHPEASDREVFLRMASRHLDRDTMIRAYGWDPAEHGIRLHVAYMEQLASPLAVQNLLGRLLEKAQP